MPMPASQTRQNILDVAVHIMSQKGKAATIAEIAREAKVTDSVIYHYFENKEDLLFHAAGEHLKTGIQDLKDHLSGTDDPLRKLGKFIGFQLYYHDENPQYANFTIFECRSKKAFFRHSAFDYFRQWICILKGIFEDGIRQQVFPPNLDSFVLRDMVFGLLDMENIMYFTGQCRQEARSDLEDILALLMPVLSFAQTEELDKSTRILNSAEARFAQSGYDKATIAEISSTAGVAEGTVYDYYKNKEDLLLSVFKMRLGEHLHSLKELFEIQTPIRKLRRFLRYHFALYATQPDFTKTLILNGLFNRRYYTSDAYKLFSQYLSTVDHILDEGKADGSIRPSVNNRIYKNLFIGAFSHMHLRWLFVENILPVDKTREINEVIDLLTRAVEAPGLNGH